MITRGGETPELTAKKFGMVNYDCDTDPTSHDKFDLGSAMWVVWAHDSEVTDNVNVAFLWRSGYYQLPHFCPLSWSLSTDLAETSPCICIQLTGLLQCTV